MEPVAILGVGRTDYTPKPSIAIPEMVHHAVQAALADAGLAITQIDAVVTASVDLYDGLTASNLAVTEVVGAVMAPESRVAGDGLLAVCQGAMAILAGAYETVLVVAHCKASMGDRRKISNWTVDPIYQQPLGLDDFAAAALQTAVLNSPAPPIPTPLADGAAVIILSRSPNPKSEVRNPKLIGMGWALDEHYLGDRDLSDSPALRKAAHRAFSMARITDSSSELSVVELSDHFEYQRELWTAVLNLNNFNNINPSGGLTNGIPPFVAGLDRLIEVVLHLRQEEVGMGLAHGCWGPAGQGQAVMVVGR
ncbi:MAG: hypothetical protein GY805_09280 [Chloroflexi bacterium]|nr:hypothetical protein [Chloroflexota bacterium]